MKRLPKGHKAQVMRTHYFQTMYTAEQMRKFAAREWVGLTDEEVDQGLVRTNYAMQTAGAWRDGVEWAQSQLKEKNT